MDRLPVKKGNIYIYVALLAAALLLMTITRNLARTNSPTAVKSEDPISIGIEISPSGVTIQGDTLGGYYYESVNRIAAKEGIDLTIDGFTQLPHAIERLNKGEYDIIIADFSKYDGDSAMIIHIPDNRTRQKETGQWAIAVRDSAMAGYLNVFRNEL